jgi:hypothetical protein
MTRRSPDSTAYKKIVAAFKSRKSGASPADIAAETGIPLYTVRELAPRAADEFSGRLEVTESGEILYSFPQGFTSRFRGFVPFLKKTSEKLIKFLGALGVFLFKAWIMVMLIGYFLFFMALALGSLFLSVAANSRSSQDRNRRGGGMNVNFGIFHLIIRLWFYSELTKPYGRGAYGGFGGGGGGRFNANEKKQPLHRAIFSFVFGEKDPNCGRGEEIKKAFAAYVQNHRGVVSLPELMVLSGLPPEKAESEITALCVEFGGSPEATADGTIVYRFDELLFNTAGKTTGVGDIPQINNTPRVFSSNQKKMNTIFALINGVNLFFGGYFLYSASTVGKITSQAQFDLAPLIYKVTYTLFSSFSPNPQAVIAAVLGILPLVFSIFFWLIPAVRAWVLNKENARLKAENFRAFCYNRIWQNPASLKHGDLNPPQNDAAYRKGGAAGLKAERDRALKEMGRYALVEVKIENEEEVYSFPDLAREKEALEKYRASINLEDLKLGNTVFDSHARLTT